MFLRLQQFLNFDLLKTHSTEDDEQVFQALTFIKHLLFKCIVCMWKALIVLGRQGSSLWKEVRGGFQLHQQQDPLQAKAELTKLVVPVKTYLRKGKKCRVKSETEAVPRSQE